MTATPDLLRVEDLQVYFSTRQGDLRAVDGVNLSIKPGETVGLVGESGSGKSVTARAIMRLVPEPPGRYAGGRILLHDRDLLAVSESEMRELRGSKISMIFQDPMTFLNPVFTAGEQVAEAIRLHQRVSKGEAKRLTIDLFRTVGIPSPESRYDSYPHQLSGGMRQRVMIAMALSCQPELLIADEPTTALDVTIQAQILDLLRQLQEQFGMGILLITHDLGVVAEMCDRVAVMYAGQIVEHASVNDLFDDPEHPYTLGLMNAIPRADLAHVEPQPIPGAPPDLLRPPSGCRFHPRCAWRQGICSGQEPHWVSTGSQHGALCHFAATGMLPRPELPLTLAGEGWQ